jgi:hypothetical protein
MIKPQRLVPPAPFQPFSNRTLTTSATQSLTPTLKAQARSTSTVVQRTINYASSYTGKSASDRADLIRQLVAEFGSANKAFIEQRIDTISRQHSSWSMKQIWVHFRKQKNAGTLPVHAKVKFSSSHKGPRPAPAEKFSFLTVTWLTGQVGNILFEPIRNNTATSEHAEERFITRVETAHRLGQLNLKSNPAIAITLNNSPCHEKCAAILARWVKKHHLTRMTIRFASPHGTESEFRAVIKVLQAAGIRIHGYEVRPLASADLTERATQSLASMGNSLRHAKANKWYVSDDESDSEENKGERRETKEARSVKPSSTGKRQGSSRDTAAEPGTTSKRSKTGHAGTRIDGVGTLHNVSGDGMNCLIRALLRSAGHRIVSDALVRALRRHLQQQGVAEAGNMLNLAGAAGVVLVQEMERRHLLNPNSGLRVYADDSAGGHVMHTIKPGPNPVNIWLSANHFQAIV